MKISIVVLLAVLLGGCVTTQSTPKPQADLLPLTEKAATQSATHDTELAPFEAVLRAAERPEGVTGTFKFLVKGTGRQSHWLYLNSELDYRDQRCLIIAVPPQTAIALEKQLGDDPTVAIKGKTIRVNGTAQRVTIWFYSNGVRTDKYYYQTQVRLTDESQLRILP